MQRQSLMAAGKLQEVKWIPQRPVTYPFQNAVNIGLLGVAVACGLALVYRPLELAYLCSSAASALNWRRCQ